MNTITNVRCFLCLVSWSTLLAWSIADDGIDGMIARLRGSRPSFRELPYTIHESTSGGRIRDCLLVDQWVVALVEECTAEPRGVFSPYVMTKCKTVSVSAFNLDSKDWRTLDFVDGNYESVKIVRVRPNSVALLIRNAEKDMQFAIWNLESNRVEKSILNIGEPKGAIQSMMNVLLGDTPGTNTSAIDRCDSLYVNDFLWDDGVEKNSDFQTVSTNPLRIVLFKPTESGFEVLERKLESASSFVKVLDNLQINARFGGDVVRKVWIPNSVGFSEWSMFLMHFESGMIRLVVVDSNGEVVNQNLLRAQAAFAHPFVVRSTNGESLIVFQFMPEDDDGEIVVIARLRKESEDDCSVVFETALIRKYPRLLNHTLFAISEDLNMGFSCGSSAIFEWYLDTMKVRQTVPFSEGE